MAIFGSQFYHQTLRRYIVAFGNMFNDMTVQRLDKAGNVIQTIGVPITYGPKEKMIARASADPNLTRPIAAQYPAIAFEMVGISYDSTRRYSSSTKNVAVSASDPRKLKYQYTPVPWNIDFSLYVYVRNADDGAQIIEQILPFFGPEWTNTVHLIPEMDISLDVPTVLNSFSTEDSYEGDMLTRRTIIHTLTFTMKGYFFGPIRHAGIIKRTQTDIGVVSANSVNIDRLFGQETVRITSEDIDTTGRSSRIVITPGLLANGAPTSNSAASIPYKTIQANTNYGIATDKYFYEDGGKYDPVTGTDNYFVGDQENR